MNNHNMRDERVVSQRLKINNEAYGIIMVVLIVSILIQQFLLDAPFTQYAAEFIAFFGISIYVIVRNMTLGLNLFGDGKRAKKIPWINSIVLGMTVTAINGILNYSKYSEHYQADGIWLFLAGLLIMFVSVSALCFALLFFLNYLNRKRQKKIDEQLDEDEQQE